MTNKLFILCGIPFSGKSTLARKMVEKLGFVRIDLDEVKISIFGDKILDSQIDQFGWDKIYQDMYRKIKSALVEGKTVVNDTGNFTHAERGVVAKIAQDLGLPVTTIFVDIPVEVAHQRILDNRNSQKRFDVSDLDFRSTVAEMEKPSNDENHLSFNYLESIDSWIEKHLIHS